MKLHVLSENLQKKLPLINHAVSSKSQLPVLLNVLLETTPQGLKLSSTDLEIGIETVIPASIEEEGSTTIPAKVFSEVIAAIPNEKILLQTSGEKLTLTSSKTKSVFQTIPTDDFPKLYEEKGEVLSVIDSAILHKDFSKVVFAASLDTSRPALSGILVMKDEAVEKGGFVLVSTDGYRLSLKHHVSDIRRNEEFEKPMIVPARVIRELLLLKDEEGDISMYISGKSNQIIFSQKDTSLVGRLIEAEFPTFEKIIPHDFGTQVTFDRGELQKAVKMSAIFARDSSNIVRLSLRNGKILVTAHTPSIGENSVEVEATLTGEENDIAFNSKYLLDFFSNVNEEVMVFEMTGPLNPGAFKIKDDPSFLHIIMPIRMQNEE